ncbi:hypothetical protein ACFFK7_08085 [Pseudoalteromonas xiamenensis]|uniref:hypothetical protein n=1 Tax=Pseudoalteromonas xiamenensis TaxID=882626 RepID=UPI0035EE8D0E
MEKVSNIKVNVFSFISNYLPSLLSSLIIRGGAIFCFILFGRFLSLEEFSDFSFAYNFSMILAGLIVSPLISVYSRYNEEFGFCFIRTMNLIFLFMFVFTLLMFLLPYQSISFVASLLVVFVFFFISQYVFIDLHYFDMEYVYPLITVFSSALMWGGLFYIYFFGFYSIGDFLVFVFIFIVFYFVLNGIYNGYVLKGEGRISGFTITGWKLLFLFRKLMPVISSSLVAGFGFALFFYVINERNIQSQEQKAVFNVAYQWFQVVVFFSVALNSKLLLTLNKNNKPEMECFKIMLLCFCLYFFALLVYVVFSTFYVGLDKGLILEVGLVIISASLLSALSNVVGVYLLYKEQLKLGFWLNIVWVVNLYVIYFVVFNGSGLSIHVALSILISYFCHFVVLILFASRLGYARSLHK